MIRIPLSLMRNPVLPEQEEEPKSTIFTVRSMKTSRHTAWPGHRHTPEIEEQLGPMRQAKTMLINFTPHLVPMNRGILITAYASLKKEVSYEEVKAAYDKYYENETVCPCSG